MLRYFPSRLMMAAALVIAGVFSPAATNGQDDAPLRDLNFFLTFIPNIQFSPLYVADAKGYFEDEGLNLIMEHGDEPVGVDLIASDEFHAGMISGEQVILARNGRRPVVYVYEWFQQYPVGLVIPDTVDIANVTDIEGLRVGIPGRFGATYSGITALLNANGLTENDIVLEPIGFVAPDLICAGNVEISTIYINNEPLQIQQRANAGECGNITSVNVIPVSDYVDLVSNGIVVSENLIENDPDLVRAILRAFDRGLADTVNNPAEAYLLSLDYVENLPASNAFIDALTFEADRQAAFLAEAPTQESIIARRATLSDTLATEFTPETLIQLQVLLETALLWDTDRPGFSDPTSWAQTQDVLLSMNLLNDEIQLDAAFTNEYLPDRTANSQDG